MIVARLVDKPNHWLDVVVFGLRMIWCVLGVLSLIYDAGDTGFALVLKAAGFLLCGTVPVLLYLRRGMPRFAAPAADLLLLGVMFEASAGLERGPFAFFQVPMLMLGYLSGGWHALWALAAALLGPFVLADEPIGMEREALVDAVANLAILFGIGLIFQKLVGSYQRINGMYGVIREQNRTLELYAKQIEKLTLAEERNRLSRDLHDTVGHTFTTTITGMDAVYYLIDLSPEEAKKSLRELLQVTRGGLDEVRRHIHQLASDQEGLPLSRTLTQIASEFALHTGTKVALESTGVEHRLPEQSRLALIRGLQESLTNAKRHGGATCIDVHLAFGQEAVCLRVTDNGLGASAIQEGFGLRAMADRMANAGGSVQWSTAAGQGMTIECAVPAQRKPRIASGTGRSVENGRGND